MNIGIDIDDTILNTIEATDYYAKEYTENTLKRNFFINKVENYGPMWFLDVYRWTLEEDQVFFKLYKNKIFGNAKPKEYVKEVLDKSLILDWEHYSEDDDYYRTKRLSAKDAYGTVYELAFDAEGNIL